MAFAADGDPAARRELDGARAETDATILGSLCDLAEQGELPLQSVAAP